MSEFKKFQEAVELRLEEMSEHNLFRVTTDREDIKNVYLNGFKEGDNKHFRESSEHDCSCCKSFIRTVGDIVAFDNDGNMMSIWDVNVPEKYQGSADALYEYIKSSPIESIFLHDTKTVGTIKNIERIENDVIEWDHFFVQLPNKVVKNNQTIGSLVGESKNNFLVLERALNEITLESIETVIELINQNSIYKGSEFLSTVQSLQLAKLNYECSTNKTSFLWNTSVDNKFLCSIRNSVIGTLLVDISNDVDLTIAVKKYEAKVAPQNYKRPTALITQSMINNAQKVIEENGLTSALQRRYASIDDITVNNVLYVDREAKKDLDMFDLLSKDLKVDVKKLDKVEEITIEKFMKDIVPKSDKIELMFENKQVNNLMSLIAPKENDVKKLFKWDNNFSYSYNGEVTDSIKESVSKAGGNIIADMRFSIMWNDNNDNQDDLDAHCKEPTGHIYFSNPKSMCSDGFLDIDVQSPGNNLAVENIAWKNKKHLEVGDYVMYVNNYAKRSNTKSGFTAQIEIDNEIFNYSFERPLKSKENVKVAQVHWDGKSFTIKHHHLKESSMSREEYGIKTNQFHTVKTIMNSPNHWDDNKVGNKHLFFMLDNCKNPSDTRGFYNEFLNDDLREHRKVFEVLGSKLKVEPSDEQLSGLGFSSTIPATLLCRVTGSFSRVLKIKI